MTSTISQCFQCYQLGNVSQTCVWFRFLLPFFVDLYNDSHWVLCACHGSHFSVTYPWRRSNAIQQLGNNTTLCEGCSLYRPRPDSCCILTLWASQYTAMLIHPPHTYRGQKSGGPSLVLWNSRGTVWYITGSSAGSTTGRPSCGGYATGSHGFQ